MKGSDGISEGQLPLVGALIIEMAHVSRAAKIWVCRVVTVMAFLALKLVAPGVNCNPEMEGAPVRCSAWFEVGRCSAWFKVGESTSSLDL